MYVISYSCEARKSLVCEVQSKHRKKRELMIEKFQGVFEGVSYLSHEI